MPPPPVAPPSPGGGKKGKRPDGVRKGEGKGARAAGGGGSCGSTGVAKAVEPQEEEEGPSAPPKQSVGSAGHDNLMCKPCAFYHTKGCSSGASCQFCHMCGPGEKKKRKKDATTPTPKGKGSSPDDVESPEAL